MVSTVVKQSTTTTTTTKHHHQNSHKIFYMKKYTNKQKYTHPHKHTYKHKHTLKQTSFHTTHVNVKPIWSIWAPTQRERGRTQRNESPLIELQKRFSFIWAKTRRKPRAAKRNVASISMWNKTLDTIIIASLLVRIMKMNTQRNKRSVRRKKMKHIPANSMHKHTHIHSRLLSTFLFAKRKIRISCVSI